MEQNLLPRQGGGKVRNVTRFNAGDLKIELLQQPALITAKYGDLHGKVVESTDLIIRNLSPARLNDAEAIAHPSLNGNVGGDRQCVCVAR